VIATYVGREDGVDVPLHAIHRDLALHMENSYRLNERRRLRPLRWAFRAAVIALVAEVAIWLLELAIASRLDNAMGVPKPSSPTPAPKPQPIFPSPMDPGTRGTAAGGGD
jgi:hypothetical protein